MTHMLVLAKETDSKKSPLVTKLLYIHKMLILPPLAEVYNSVSTNTPNIEPLLQLLRCSLLTR